ncbi:MAG: deoxyribonuclease V [Anaerolineae bacterium]|nr:deoxyribonuclease V [Anaerolineae bacterium]MEB2365586.1 deoxyribonuclease V [Chloroflexota bacterium]
MILHDWPASTAEAKAIQLALASRVDFDSPLDLASVETVAGVDVSVRNRQSTAAVVVMRRSDFTVLDTAVARIPTPFPYVPGLLSFREIPVILLAWDTLKIQPDVALVDGMGRIHPRQIGLACHLGLWIDRPTVGVGKSHLLGDYQPPGVERGEWSPLVYKDEMLGAVLRTRAGVKPVYVSSGHRVDLDSALALVMACTTRYRLPEPIRAAHVLAGSID